MKRRVTLRVESLDNRIMPGGVVGGEWAQVVPSAVETGHGGETAQAAPGIVPSGHGGEFVSVAPPGSKAGGAGDGVMPFGGGKVGSDF